MKTLCFNDPHGRQFQLDVHPLDARFPAVGGVVVYIRGTTPVYVWHSHDLTQLIDDEVRQCACLLHGANNMAVMQIEPVADRSRIAAGFINKYHPVCNDNMGPFVARKSKVMPTDIAKLSHALAMLKPPTSHGRHTDLLKYLPDDKFYTDYVTATIVGRKRRH